METTPLEINVSGCFSFLGNGKVVWTDGTCVKAVFEDQEKAAEIEVTDDLSF